MARAAARTGATRSLVVFLLGAGGCGVGRFDVAVSCWPRILPGGMRRGVLATFAARGLPFVVFRITAGAGARCVAGAAVNDYVYILSAVAL